jgi:mRNA interferase MazF
VKKGIANLPKSSVVVISQMATVDKSRLLDKIGSLPVKLIEEIVKGCRMAISLHMF